MKAFQYEMVKCGQCQAHFPKSWLTHPEKSGACKFGTIPFCCEKCKGTFIINLSATLTGTRTNPTFA